MGRVVRARYVFRDGQFIERKTGEPMSAPDRIASPMLMADVHYKSPLSGKEVTSRSQRRDSHFPAPQPSRIATSPSIEVRS